MILFSGVPTIDEPDCKNAENLSNKNRHVSLTDGNWSYYDGTISNPIVEPDWAAIKSGQTVSLTLKVMTMTLEQKVEFVTQELYSAARLLSNPLSEDERKVALALVKRSIEALNQKETVKAV